MFDENLKLTIPDTGYFYLLRGVLRRLPMSKFNLFAEVRPEYYGRDVYLCSGLDLLLPSQRVEYLALLILRMLPKAEEVVGCIVDDVP